MRGPGGAGLYLHVPFCSAVCPYCDFAVLRDDPDRHRTFVEAMLAEASDRAAELGDETIDTIYFGGGTPSALGDAHLAELLEGLRARLPVAPAARIHLEANPEDLTEARLAAWRELGLDFLSLGIQSFRDEELRFLGRRHDAREARRGLARAVASGIPVVSCDLIFGLPNQTVEDLAESLRVVGELRPGHVSGYQLTIEPRTVFGRRVAAGRWEPLPDPEQGALFDHLHEGLAQGGYEAYEVSNFRRDVASGSAHNQKYWDRRPYLGLGPSAHSFDGDRRSWNHRELASWSQAIAAGRGAVLERELLSNWDRIAETLMLGLRRPQGVDAVALFDETGFDLASSASPYLEEACDEGSLFWEGRFLRPTRRGLAIADALATRLCPEPPA